jgi:hypothetical protein
MHAMTQSNSTSKLLRLLVLPFVFLSHSGTAHAQVLVTDTAAISASEEGFKSQLAQSMEQYTRQGLQYAKQLDQYYQQVEQYKQLLMTVKGIGTQVSLTSNKLKRIEDPTALIDQTCPGSSGGSITGTLVTSIVGINSEDPITSSQRQICANIVVLQVDEYNRTVGMLDQLDQYGATLQKLGQLANEVNSLGTTSGATTQAATFSAITAHAMQQWQAAVAGHEAIIEALNQHQSVLAKIALKGARQGDLVQAAAFAAAFK